MKKLLKVTALLLLVVMMAMIAGVSVAEDIASEPAVPEQTVNAPVAAQAPEAAPQPAAQPAADPTAEPEATVEPAVAVPAETVAVEAAVAPEATQQADQEATATASPDNTLDLSNVSVTTEYVVGANVQYGDTVTVVAHISGLDGVQYATQWQYYDGAQWQDQRGANAQKYSFTLDKNNANYSWRVVVTVA